jgi:hypothetical protein
MPVTRKLSLLACGVAVLSAAVGINTASAQTAAAGRTSDDSTSTVQVAGQTVAIDRATGRLRPPTAAERKALAAGLKNILNRSTEGLTVVQRPDGAKSVDLQGRFQAIAIAKVNADGKVAEQCVTSQREADALVNTSRPKNARQSDSKKAATGANRNMRKGEVR